MKIYKRSSCIWDICIFRPMQLYSEKVLQVHKHYVGLGSTKKSYLPYQQMCPYCQDSLHQCPIDGS